MSQNDNHVGRIRILNDTLAIQQDIQLRSELMNWNSWLQKARTQENDSHEEDRKKAEEKKQVDRALERRNVEKQADIKAKQHLQLILQIQQNQQILTALRNTEKIDLRNRPFSFWSQRIKRYRDWLQDNPEQQSKKVIPNEKGSDKNNLSQQTQATQYKVIQAGERSSILRHRQIKRALKDENKKENKEGANQLNEADQAFSKSEQLAQLDKEQSKAARKKEALQKLAAASERNQTPLPKENEGELIESKEMPEQPPQIPLTQKNTTEQTKNSAQADEKNKLSGTQVSVISRPKKSSAKSTTNIKDDEHNEPEEEKSENEVARSTEQNQDDSNGARAQTAPYPEESASASSKASSIDTLSSDELFSKTGPLAQIIEAVTKFCCNGAVNALEQWELEIKLDHELLADTKLIVCISVSDLLLRFTSADPNTNALICRHSKTLHYKLTKYMKQYDYPRVVKIELNDVLL